MPLPSFVVGERIALPRSRQYTPAPPRIVPRCLRIGAGFGAKRAIPMKKTAGWAVSCAEGEI